MKTCTACGKDKPLDDYGWTTAAHTMLIAMCKECRKSDRQKYRGGKHVAKKRHAEVVRQGTPYATVRDACAAIGCSWHALARLGYQPCGDEEGSVGCGRVFYADDLSEDVWPLLCAECVTAEAEYIADFRAARSSESKSYSKTITDISKGANHASAIPCDTVPAS